MKRAFIIALGVTVGLAFAVVAQAGRDSSGTMTFTSVAGGYPFVSGQVISSSGVNANMAEIITELSDSASRSGKGGFTAPVRGADGAVGAPTFSFTSDTNTGFYRIGADRLGVALGGVKKIDCEATTGCEFAGPIIGAAGLTITASGITLSEAADERIQKSGGDLVIGTTASNYIEFITSNVSRLVIEATGNLDVKSARITNMGTPTATTDAVTKAYADAPDVVTTTATLSANWSLASPSINRAAKRGGVVSFRLGAAQAGGGAAWTSVATLPAGYRPGEALVVFGTCLDSGTATYPCTVAIGTDGVIQPTLYDNGTSLASMFTIGSGDELSVTATFLAEN